MKVLNEFEITDNKKLVLSIGEYRGDERIDLRQYVKVSNEYIPTKKGVKFNSEWIDKFIEMIEKLKDIWNGSGQKRNKKREKKDSIYSRGKEPEKWKKI